MGASSDILCNQIGVERRYQLRRIKQKRIEVRVCLDPFLCPEAISAIPAATKKLQNHVLTYANKCSKL